MVIPAATLPLGLTTLGTVTAATPWQHVELTLDIAGVTAADLRVELSTDDGATWQHLVSALGLTVGLNQQGLPITTEHLVADWGEPTSPTPQPPGLVRATISNATAFVSTGGSLLVS